MSVAARIALGLVFLVSGASKLAERTWPSSAAAFGVPRWAARLLPIVELVVGALLVPGLGGAWVVGVAAALLVAFTAVIVLRLLADGDRPVCACFGAWSTRPISWRTVARNAGLLALAVVAAIDL